MKHTGLLVLMFVFAALGIAQPVEKDTVHATYVLGPDDQIKVNASDIEEISGAVPIRIDMTGTIKLPMVGRIQAAGLTAEHLEVAIAAKLKKYMQNPEVVVSVADFRSQPDSRR
jgi:polysaccharide export outer membrane protein